MILAFSLGYISLWLGYLCSRTWLRADAMKARRRELGKGSFLHDDDALLGAIEPKLRHSSINACDETAEQQLIGHLSERIFDGCARTEMPPQTSNENPRCRADTDGANGSAGCSTVEPGVSSCDLGNGSWRSRDISFGDGLIGHEIALLPRAQSTPNVTVIVIPGNPGVPLFYRDMMLYIFEQLGQTAEVCLISHAGHTKTIDEKSEHREKVYGFEDQVCQKLHYMKLKISEANGSKEVQFCLVGHSIGGYMALRILQKYPSYCCKVALLQPTLIRMRHSPNGIFLFPILKTMRTKVARLANVLGSTPLLMRRAVAIALSVPAEYSGAITCLLDYAVALNALTMGYQELEQINELFDVSGLQIYQDRLLFAFSTSDGWVPRSFADELRQKFVGSTFLSGEEWKHAFMLKPGGSSSMASIISFWIGNF